MNFHMPKRKFLDYQNIFFLTQSNQKGQTKQREYQ